MNKNVLPWLIMLAFFASCSTAYKTTQTPDDVYYSPGKAKEYAAVKTDENKDDSYSRNNSRSSRQSSDNDDYQDYTASSNDNYLRMKIQNRYQWNSLDDNDYWYSPNYAYNNYYGFNSFNPYTLNTWGLSYYYSPFASIQPTGWFNNYYPSYGCGYGYSPYNSGFYGHSSGYGYYGYSPVNVVVVSNNRTRTSRSLLGGYTNNNYNNYNSNNNRSGRYVQPDNGISRYNNTNNSARYSNGNGARNNNTNTNTNNTYTPPARTYTPSTSGGSSSSGSSSGSSGGASRPVRH